ncbi:helicase, partial [Anaerovorax odorimutans]|nr:helicase [Anaerovorax odorimutans]
MTEGTFDAYLYQIIENKQKFISQIMTSKSPARTAEDIDEVALSYAEIKALASGNPAIKEKMDLDVQVSKLQLLKQNFLSQKYDLEDQVTRKFPKEIEMLEQEIAAYQTDIRLAKEHTPAEREIFPIMEIQGTDYGDKQKAGQALLEACRRMNSPKPVAVGKYRGFAMELRYNSFEREFQIALKGTRSHIITLGTDAHGNITRLDNAIARLEDKRESCQQQLIQVKARLATAKQEAKQEFAQEKELAEKLARLGELNALLDMDKND